MPKSMVTSDMKHMVGVEAKKKLEKEQEELREKMIASGELDDDYDGIEEFDELDEDNADLAEIEEAYVDEHINVEGFDTSTSNAAEVNEAEEETAKDNSLHKNDNEEVA